MKKTTILVCGYIVALTLSSCGQTGPLYLPDEETANSGSTIATSGSTVAASGSSLSQDSSSSTNKVDNDPNPPAKDYNNATNELVDTGDNFGFDKNIQDSSEAGGTPF